MSSYKIFFDILLEIPNLETSVLYKDLDKLTQKQKQTPTQLLFQQQMALETQALGEN